MTILLRWPARHRGGRAPSKAGWRLLIAVAAFLVLFVARDTPMGPLLRLSTHPTTLQTTIGGPAAWLCLPGLALVAVAAFVATRLT